MLATVPCVRLSSVGNYLKAFLLTHYISTITYIYHIQDICVRIIKNIKLKDMSSSERYQKTTEILRMFKNGEELYKRNAMFHQAVQMILEGMDIPEVLEQIILASERTQRAFEDYVNRDTRPMGGVNAP